MYLQDYQDAYLAITFPELSTSRHLYLGSLTRLISSLGLILVWFGLTSTLWLQSHPIWTRHISTLLWPALYLDSPLVFISGPASCLLRTRLVSPLASTLYLASTCIWLRLVTGFNSCHRLLLVCLWARLLCPASAQPRPQYRARHFS